MRELTGVECSSWSDANLSASRMDPPSLAPMMMASGDGDPSSASSDLQSVQPHQQLHRQQHPDLAQAITEFNSSFVTFLGSDENSSSVDAVHHGRASPIPHIKAEDTGHSLSALRHESGVIGDDDPRLRIGGVDGLSDEDAEGELFDAGVDEWGDTHPSDSLSTSGPLTPASYDSSLSSTPRPLDFFANPGDVLSGFSSGPIKYHPFFKQDIGPLLPQLRERIVSKASSPQLNSNGQRIDEVAMDQSNMHETDPFVTYNTGVSYPSSSQHPFNPRSRQLLPRKRLRIEPDSNHSSTRSPSVGEDQEHQYQGERRRSMTPLRRTEMPAVEDDPSIAPYGCHLCWLRARQSEAEEESRLYTQQHSSSRSTSELHSLDSASDYISTFRTIRELREHARIHKKAGDCTSDTPYRCSLDPCGKTFKSVGGLLWHFTSASGGHFFVSMEEGEDQPTKKFKRYIEENGRKERCPIPGCNKSFKQAAGLAYHLAHAPGHPEKVTRSMLSTFPLKVASKTRWHFNRLGITFAS